MLLLEKDGWEGGGLELRERGMRSTSQEEDGPDAETEEHDDTLH